MAGEHLDGWDDEDRRDAALRKVIADVADAPFIPEELLRHYSGKGTIEGEPTRAELEVLQAFSRGLGYLAVAEVLGRPIETVKSQAKHARFLLRTKNTTAACCEAVRRGLIP